MDGNGPPGSRIAVSSSDDRFIVEIPPRGFHWAAAGQLVGALLVLIVCAQWTGRHGSRACATALPFWVLGFGLAATAVSRMVKHHRVDLRVDAGWTRVFPIGWKKPLRTPTLAVRLDRVTRGEADGRGGTGVPVLVLDDGHRAVRLMEGFTDVELEWVGTELSRWLARRPAGR